MKVDAKNKKTKVHMPKMGNYSKSRIRQSLNIFMKAPVRQTPLNPVVGTSDVDGWTRIRGVMDSGASESVGPEGMCPAYPVTPSPGSLSGQEYVSASKDLIPNLGEQVLDVITEGGQEKSVKYQIADVSRPLNSISEICDAGGDAGQVVVFGRGGGAVVNMTTVAQTPFKREDGIYVMDVWVKPKGFPGQGF